MYEYRATLLRVVDGDTVWLEVDLGFDVKRRDSFRLYGINTPELPTPEGKAAAAWLMNRLAGISVLVVTTNKDRREKYGRYLATLWDGGTEGQSINQEMVVSGIAVEYMSK